MRAMVFLTLAALAAGPAAADTLVVGNKGEDTVSLIDVDSGEERARLETGSQPHEVAISPDGTQAAVVAYGGTTVDIIDIARAQRVDRIDLSPNQRPHGIVWLADGRLVATTEDSGTLTVVGPDGAISSIPTGQRVSHMVAVSPDLARAYVSNMESGTVSVIDLAAGRKLRDLPAGAAPEGIALSPDGGTLWAADRDSATLYAFDTSTFQQLHRIEVGDFPIRVAVASDGTVITSNAAEGSLSLIDAASGEVMRTIPVSGTMEAMQVTIALAPDGRTLYAAETNRARIVAVDLESGNTVRTYAAGQGSDGLAISPVDVAAD